MVNCTFAACLHTCMPFVSVPSCCSWPNHVLCLNCHPQVQAGVGRTGKWWGHSQFDDEAMKPDIMIFAKVRDW